MMNGLKKNVVAVVILMVVVAGLVLWWFFTEPPSDTWNHVQIINASDSDKSFQLYVDGVLMERGWLPSQAIHYYNFVGDGRHTVSVIASEMSYEQQTGDTSWGPAHRTVIFVIP